MNAQAAAPAHRMHLHMPAKVVIPALYGMAFGAYAGFLDRQEGAATHNAIILGVVGAVVAAVIAFALGRVQGSLPRETVAFLYAALSGCSVGFLNSMCGANTWLKSTFIGFFFGAGMFLVAYYVLLYHRRE